MRIKKWDDIEIFVLPLFSSLKTRGLIFSELRFNNDFNSYCGLNAITFFV